MGSLVRAQEREQKGKTKVFPFLFILMHYVYIIQSLKTGRFYCGETPDVSVRLTFHNNIEKNTNSTKTGIPWEFYWCLEVQDRILARKIESHIKLMKSTKYYSDLKSYPEISHKLIQKYLNN